MVVFVFVLFVHTHLSVKWITLKVKEAVKFVCIFLRHPYFVLSTTVNFPFFYFLWPTPEHIIEISINEYVTFFARDP